MSANESEEKPSVSVFLHGLIMRPVLSVPWTKEEIRAQLRANLSYRIQGVRWGGEEENTDGED